MGKIPLFENEDSFELNQPVGPIENELLDACLAESDLCQSYIDYVNNTIADTDEVAKGELMKALDAFTPQSAEEAGAKAAILFLLKSDSEEDNLDDDRDDNGAIENQLEVDDELYDTAYEDGRKAANDGISRDDNPHKQYPDSVKFEGWEEGWDSAQGGAE
jgi:hypothetical protein